MECNSHSDVHFNSPVYVIIRFFSHLFCNKQFSHSSNMTRFECDSSFCSTLYYIIRCIVRNGWFWHFLEKGHGGRTSGVQAKIYSLHWLINYETQVKSRSRNLSESKKIIIHKFRSYGRRSHTRSTFSEHRCCPHYGGRVQTKKLLWMISVMSRI